MNSKLLFNLEPIESVIIAKACDFVAGSYTYNSLLPPSHTCVTRDLWLHLVRIHRLKRGGCYALVIEKHNESTIDKWKQLRRRNILTGL